MHSVSKSYNSTIFFVYLLLVLFMTVQCKSSLKMQSFKELDNVIKQAVQNIWQEIEVDQPIWNMPPWLGTLFISEYYFELKALNITGDLKFNTKFDQTFFKDKLVNTQFQDGSWEQVVDKNKKQGSLDATIFNYWFLKDYGLDTNSKTMKRARKFVLDHGGLENSQLMTRFKLATFGQYEWHLLPYIPLFIYKNYYPFTYFMTYIKDYIAQWVYPHMIPLAYLRYHKAVFPVSTVCLSELRVSRSSHCEEIMKEQKNKTLNQNSTTSNLIADSDVDNLLEEAIKIKGNKGLYGAYTISSLLTLLSFKDYSMRYDNKSDLSLYYRKTHLESLNFIQQLYFNRRAPYEGSLDDGRYWDTLLITWALLEAGENPAKVQPTVQFLIQNAVQPNGGIPYGLEFEYAPDIDDTSILLLLYGKMSNFQRSIGNPQKYDYYLRQIKRTFNWLSTTQNQDGGFPAFDKNRNDNQSRIIAMIFQWIHMDKSAQIFDPSCPDIVGHILQGFGQADLNQKGPQRQIINKAISYLVQSKDSGMWSGRWGINYIYASGTVLPGLARIGFDLNQPWVLNVIRKLQKVQHSDGGFGEDPDSYNKGKFIDGVSTVSMTAWGLLAYIEVADIFDVDDHIQRAVNYIIKNFKQNDNKFFDRSVVGTGHRGLVYLQYPSYAYSFPLIALGRVRQLLKGKRKTPLNEAINESFKKSHNSTYFGQL